MAADVKIGLLLSLVFVFVLAFVLNSVPHSGDRKGASDLAPLVVEGPPGIKPEIPPEALPAEPVSQRSAEETTAPQTAERYRATLPEISTSQETAESVEPTNPEPAHAGKDTKATEQAPAAVRYIVRDGDSLAYIARKFYGPVQGNKRENVMKIYEANRGILKSPDQIDVGQELVIPPLEVAQPQKKAEQSIFSDSMFEKVESIGRKPL